MNQKVENYKERIKVKFYELKHQMQHFLFYFCFNTFLFILTSNSILKTVRQISLDKRERRDI